MMCDMLHRRPHPNFILRPVGPLRTLIPLSTTAGDELEITTEPDGPGTLVSILVRRWRSSTDGVIITINESDPHTLARSHPHPEMAMVAAHPHALEHLESMGPEDPVLRQIIVRGRITSPTTEEDPRRLDDPEDSYGEL